jgi:hypothetical protein
VRRVPHLQVRKAVSPSSTDSGTALCWATCLQLMSNSVINYMGISGSCRWWYFPSHTSGSTGSHLVDYHHIPSQWLYFIKLMIKGLWRGAVRRQTWTSLWTAHLRAFFINTSTGRVRTIIVQDQSQVSSLLLICIVYLLYSAQTDTARSTCCKKRSGKQRSLLFANTYILTLPYFPIYLPVYLYTLYPISSLTTHSRKKKVIQRKIKDD